MIGFLRGQIIHKQPPLLLVDVRGVGYELEAPMTTFYALPEAGGEVELLTHLLVRDDAHLLFGFASENERRLFRALIKVNGVGARLALTILSGIEAAEFARCVQTSDAARLTALPGVGKKTAARLIVEMRDRLTTGPEAAATAPGVKPALGAAGDPIADAISALVALGYKPAEAGRYVRAVAADNASAETLIRQALQHSVKK